MNKSARQRARFAYAVGAVGLLGTIVIAFTLPTWVASPCSLQFDCFKELNTTKVVLILLSLLIAVTGGLLGGFRSYLADH